MPNIPYFHISIKDGKGQTSSMRLYSERLDYTDYGAGKWHEAMGDNILQDLEPIIDGEIVACNFVWPVEFDFTPQVADPDSDVEEGALFTFYTENGYKKQVRIPTFKESLMISGSADVDMTDGAVQDFVNTIIDGPDAVPDVLEDRINMTDNRGEDIVGVEDGADSFGKTRGNA